MLSDISPDPGVVVPPSAVSIRAVRASGPGGQRVNKASTKVVMTVDLSAIDGLADEQRATLRDLVPRHQRDAFGHLVLSSQRFRDRIRNQQDVEQKLRQLLVRVMITAPVRKVTTPNIHVARQRLLHKKVRAERLALRRVPDERAWA